MFHKTKNKNKKWFFQSCLWGFSSKNVSIEHKEKCLSINGKQSVKLEKKVTESQLIRQVHVIFSRLFGRFATLL